MVAALETSPTISQAMKMEIFKNRSGSSKKKKGDDAALPLDERKQDELNGIAAGLNNINVSSKHSAIDNILDSDDESGGMVFADDDSGQWDPTAMFTNKTTAVPPSDSYDTLRNAEIERAAMAAANTALCAVPAVAHAPLAKLKATADKKPLTIRRRSDANDDDEDDDDEDDDDEGSDKSGEGSDSGSDYTDDENEGEAGYKPGGYHPVKVGEVYNQRYVVIKKLGWGHFSTVWMVKDRKVIATGGVAALKEQFFAIKVQKSAEHYTDAAMDEVELLDCAASERKVCEAAVNLDSADSDSVTPKEMVDYSRHVASLHDSFFHTGPNGRHMCMVFTMLGCNLLGVIKAFNYRGIPVPVVKNIIRGICKGLDFLHRKCNIIHTDLKPENILLQFPNQISPAEREESAVAAEEANQQRNPLAVSLVELEMALKDPNLPADERKRIKNRIRKKKQKENKGIDLIEEEDDDDDEEEDAVNLSTMSILSDFEMESIMSKASGEITSMDSHNRVLRRLPHSSFVLCNFGQQQATPDSKLSRIMQKDVKVSHPSAAEFGAHLQNQKNDGSGVAKISFLLRAYTPEEELADYVSVALDNLPWEQSKDKNTTREW